MPTTWAVEPSQRLAGARVVLVSLADDLTCVGLRTIAAVLQRQCATVTQVYLPARHEGTGGPWRKQLAEIASGATVVGLSVLSVDAPRAAALSRWLREQGAVVAWGGPYPTLRPQRALEVAQYVCRGDGEGWMANLVEASLHGRDPANVLPPPGEPSAPVAPALLDTVPLVGASGWLLRDGRLRMLTTEDMQAELSHNPASRDTGTVAYETVTSRGCPHRCAFCGSTALRAAVPGPALRWRSVDSVMTELHRAREAYPFLTGFGFADDNFPARPLPRLRALARRYRDEIGLPFICLGSPATWSKERLDLLVDAGLCRVKMGIQSGSERVQETLDRTALHHRIPQAIEAIAAHGERLLPPRFDLLVDLPFQTLEDELQTLRLVADLPRPHRLELNSLRLMEGTPLHDKALAEGWATPDVDVTFKQVQPRYTNLLLAMSRDTWLSPHALRLLSRPGLARVMSQGAPARGLALTWRGARALRRTLRRS